MTISRSTPIHGTGHTVGEVIDETVRCLPVATASVLGGVKIGSGVSVTGDGTISVAGGGGGGYVPVPGSPTKFIRVTYTHPGTEDGSGVYVPIPGTDISEKEAYILSFQYKVQAGSDLIVLGTEYVGFGPYVYARRQGNDAGIDCGHDSGVSYNFTSGGEATAVHYNMDARALSDNEFWPDGITPDPDAPNSLAFRLWGMGASLATDWVIEVQLAPLAPTPRPTTATGL